MKFLQHTSRLHTCIASLFLAFQMSAFAQIDAPPVRPGDRQYSPYPEENFPNQVFFGDTLLHTWYSTDARMFRPASRSGPISLRFGITPNRAAGFMRDSVLERQLLWERMTSRAWL